MTTQNYPRALVATILSFAFTLYAQASSRTWTINTTTTTISDLMLNNPIGGVLTPAGVGGFLESDNITIAQGPVGTVYTLIITEPNVIIGDLLWCSGLSPLQLETGAVDIGSGTSAFTLTVRPNSRNINIGYIDIAGSNNKLILDSSNLLPNAIRAQELANPPAVPAYALLKKPATFTGIYYSPLIRREDWGLLELKAYNNPLGYSFPINDGITNYRLHSLTFSGDSLIEGDVSQAIYAKNVIFATSGNVILPPLIMGDNSTITLQNDLTIGTVASTVLVTSVKGSLSLSGSSTIDLSKYKFNIIGGLSSSSIYGFTYTTAPTDTGLVLEAQNVQINTYFDQTLQSGAGDGGRFILDPLTQVKIENNMTIILSTNANAAGLSYNLFSGQGTIDAPVADRILGNQNSNTDSTTLVSNKTIIFNQPVPGVIYWTYDPNYYVISSHINPVQVVPTPNDPPPTGSQTPNPNPSLPTITFTDTSVLPQTNITAAVARLVPSTSDKVAIDEANDVAFRDIATRVFKIPEDDFVGSSGVSSGDVDKQYSGVWFSPFIQKAKQKDTKNTYGYKINNYGGTLGIDRMFGENLALGIAWTTFGAHVKLSGFKAGDKSNVDTNIFSIYSLYNLSNRWFIQSHASAGQSHVKVREWRYNSDNTLGIAAAKYKSYSYNIQASVGKRIYITSLIDFIPSVGMVYNNVNSDGYTETGNVPTLSVTKRSSYALDALFGAKLSGSYEYQDYIIKPELMTAAQLNIAKRNMKVNYTASFLKPVTLDVRQSRSWYSAGVGMTLYKGSMEYAVSYETQVDKGYLGHVGIIKIRINF